MPPGPAYNWLCVANSVCSILSHAAQIRAAQLARAGQAVSQTELLSRKRKRDESYPYPRTGAQNEAPTAPVEEAAFALALSPNAANAAEIPLEPAQDGLARVEQGHPAQGVGKWEQLLPASSAPSPAFGTEERSQPQRDSPASPPIQAVSAEIPRAVEVQDIEPVARTAVIEPSAVEKTALGQHTEVPSVGDVSASTGLPDPGDPLTLDRPRNRNLQSSKVPSSRLGRLFHYGGLAASLGYGAASELIRRTTSSADEQAPSSLMLTEGNIKRLVSKLTQMRGAALKLGQFMSIQDSHVLPPEIEDIFRRVQDSAHYMPDWQMEQVMQEALGRSWMDNFESFDRLPFAAASIGQVHSAVLKASVSPTGSPARVAVKVQFPNIVNSINSDLGYVKMLLTAGKLLPRGLFLDRTIQVMKEELADECDYSREAAFARRFGQADHLGSDPRFKIPWVWEGSTDRVLVMEHVDGVSVGGSVIDRLSQRDRDDIAERIIDLCLRELFVFRVMQTDPNWTNFLWNPRTRKVELVDFGATREYSKEFIDNWLHLLSAAVAEDRDACVEWSLKLGYLTGQENEIMLDAHVKSMVLLGTPFKASTPQPFKFGHGSTWADITAEIRAQIPVMLQHRLTPPPRETYSLNRKLSGAFLLASRLNASVDCRTLWQKVIDGYRFG
ncbi:ABC1-domain-containing protein [Trametes sanguinea]|nr:ABC1-domain-containing protein [Trametes sanguinea]